MPTRSGRTNEQVLVIGLGRFGSAVAHTLTELGNDVVGVDLDSRLVQQASPTLPLVLEADTTDPEALRQLGAAEFDEAVVGIGTNIEASILTTAALADLGVPVIWAKAVSAEHGRILERVGAHHVVFPEHDAGVRIAHLVSGHIMEYLEFDPGFALVETRAIPAMIGRSLADLALSDRYGVTIVCVKPAGGRFTHATASTVVAAGDVLVAVGGADRVEAFARLR
ncbi:MAG: potassium channel family protein [Actinomycetota bacterium]